MKPRLPGDPDGTDPEGLIRQPFVAETPTGSFLEVSISDRAGEKLHFAFYDSQGNMLYEQSRPLKP